MKTGSVYVRSLLRLVDNTEQVHSGAEKRTQRVLLLQGPVGPFFGRLQEHFLNSGFDCWRVTFNAADKFFARKHNTLHFGGGIDELEFWLADLIAKHAFEAVIYFGAEKPIHVVARQICERENIACLALEEGYFRPGFVSVEIGGNNWRSPIAGKIPPAELEFTSNPQRRSGRSSLHEMSFFATVYYLLHGLFSNRQEKELFHKPARAKVFSEALKWSRNVWRRWQRSQSNGKLIAKLLEHHVDDYYLVPLQVRDDAQLSSIASCGWTNESLCEDAIRSFAQHAHAHKQLVFKIHPLDRGHTDDFARIKALSAKYNVADRVHVVDQGSVGLLTRHCAAMLTINSSSGLSALFANKPLGVLGKAIYSNSKLVHVLEKSDDLDSFWNAKRVCSLEFCRKYLTWIRTQSVVAGDFYLKSEIPETANNIVARCRQAIMQNAVDTTYGMRTDYQVKASNRG